MKTKTDKRELYYNYLEELRKEMTQRNGMIQEEHHAIQEMKKALRELEKKQSACEQKFTAAIAEGFENWQPDLIQQAELKSKSESETKEKKFAKKFLPAQNEADTLADAAIEEYERDNKTASTESKSEAEKELEYITAPNADAADHADADNDQWDDVMIGESRILKKSGDFTKEQVELCYLAEIPTLKELIKTYKEKCVPCLNKKIPSWLSDQWKAIYRTVKKILEVVDKKKRLTNAKR
jgi:hypothetical protein